MNPASTVPAAPSTEHHRAAGRRDARVAHGTPLHAVLARLLMLSISLSVHAGCGATLKVSAVDGSGRFCLGAECYRLGALDDAWRVVRRQPGGLGYFNAALGAVIQATANCRDDLDAAPLQSLTDHLLIGYTEREVRSTRTESLVEREARRTVVDVKLDGVPMVLDLYVVRRNGCLFDLGYAAPPATYALGVADFERFVAGLSPTRPVAGR